MPRAAAQRDGEALRSALLDRYDLEPHELVLLDSAAHTANLIGDLQAVIDRDGPMVDGRPNPAAVEVRSQRLTLGRLQRLASARSPRSLGRGQCAVRQAETPRG
jgi:hypothetical protein